MSRSTVEPQTEVIIGIDQKANPIKVLHVDDDAGFLKLAKQVLQTEGPFQVETALSVQEAFEKMKKEKFDVIVSDYMMPEKDGLAFLKELRENGENIPFIIFTGKGREEIAKKALNLGADQYLNKTGDPEIVYCELARSITKAAKIREAEEALRESEEKFRAISESAGNATISIDAQGTIVFWNRVAETIFGYSANEMIGKPVTLAMPERFRDDHQRKTAIWFSLEPPALGKTFEIVGLRKDGSEFPLEASFSMWKMKSETFLTIAARDITRQKQTWEALKRAEEEAKSTLSLLSATLESTADGILVVNMEGKMAVFNRKFVEMWHIPDEIVASRDNSQALEFVRDQLKEPEKSLAKVRELYAQLDVDSHDLLEFKDGRVFERYSRPQRIGGTIAGRVWSFRDVTEDKKAEKQIRENKQKFEGLFIGNPEAAVYLSPDYHILDMNPRFFELFGYPLEEIKGKHINEVVVPPDRTEEGHMLDQRAAKGYVYFDTFRKRKGGSLIPVSVSAAPIIVEGRLVGYVAMYKDISELKGTEAAMKEMMQKLATMNEKLRVVGNLTRHDVRNKLSVVTGNIFLAKKRLPDNPRVLENLHDIDSACQQILEIFDFARNYETLGDEELKNVDVAETVEKAVSLFSDLKGIEVSNECQRLKVLSDSLLTRLFYNLIDNSLKYGEKITHIRVYYEKSDKTQLRLIYQDDGNGILLAEKPNLFKEGYGKGTGYGLYLIKKMMEVYGWTIQETGEPGRGAQFTITIPRTNEKGKENYQTD
jgi:two-component system sensor histidine kinase/response regulator